MVEEPILDVALLRQATGIDPSKADAHEPRLPVVHSRRDTASWQAIYDWLRRRVQATDAILLVEDCRVKEVGEDDQAAWAAIAASLKPRQKSSLTDMTPSGEPIPHSRRQLTSWRLRSQL